MLSNLKISDWIPDGAPQWVIFIITTLVGLTAIALFCKVVFFPALASAVVSSKQVKDALAEFTRRDTEIAKATSTLIDQNKKLTETDDVCPDVEQSVKDIAASMPAPIIGPPADQGDK